MRDSYADDLEVLVLMIVAARCPRVLAHRVEVLR
jgi:hypothetical protein